MLTGSSHWQHKRSFLSDTQHHTVKGRLHSGKGQCVELLTVLSDGAIKHIKVHSSDLNETLDLLPRPSGVALILDHA